MLVAELPAWVADGTQAAGLVVAVGGAVGVLLAAIRAVLVNAMRSDPVKAVIREEAANAVEGAVAEVNAQLRPNGGFSFRDRVEARFAAGDERMARIEEDLATLVARSDPDEEASD